MRRRAYKTHQKQVGAVFCFNKNPQIVMSVFGRKMSVLDRRGIRRTATASGNEFAKANSLLNLEVLAKRHLNDKKQ